MRKVFTLVEIVVAVAIVTTLATIAIPNLLRTRINANEGVAVATLHTFDKALQSFNAANSLTGFPVDLTALAPAGKLPYAPSTLTVVAPTRSGYNFAYSRDVVAAGGLGVQYHIHSFPVSPNVTGTRGFYIDESGVVCGQEPAGADPGHKAAGVNCPAGYTMVE